MCDCIDQMNAELAKKNTQLNVVFSMTTGKTLGVAVDVGPIEKKRNYRRPLIIATFCPFCGERYAPAESDERPLGREA
jgi:hypothetical protein